MKNISVFTLYTLYALFTFLLLPSCRPAKKVQKIEEAFSKKDTTQTVVVNTAVDSSSLIKNIITNLSEKKIDFKTFSAKIKIDYEGNDASDQATAYIRMQKDSIIWISLTGALGIEGFRLLVNKDSVKLMNKLEKKIQYRRVSYLQELTDIPVDFYGLQDLIIGNPVFLDTNIVSYKNSGNELLILMTGNIFKHLLTVNNQNFKILHSKLDDIDAAHNRTCDITYSDYETQNNVSFSTTRKITVAERSKLNIQLVFKQYEFNKPLTFPFTIPKNFSRR
ncbi:MAG: DUF4292 domain-containing protein [Parafilimonas sp.]